MDIDIKLALQPKQLKAFHESQRTPVYFFGGAKGGGKSHLVRAREIFRRLKHPNTQGLIFRKTYPELLANHIRPFFKEYPYTRDWYNKAEKTIYYPNGSTTEFSYLQNHDDVYTYQGREYEDISGDEITGHEEETIKILLSSNRTSNMDFAKQAIPTAFFTGNPGGIGHAWVKRIFIDRDFLPEEEAEDYGFMQAKVYDNQALLQADPKYLKRLMALPEMKRRAYLDGDWDVFEGAVFEEFRREKHVTEPFEPSTDYPHYLGIDWGYRGRDSHKGAFAAYAMALVEEVDDVGDKFNRVIIYREWYGKEKTPEQWADIIRSQSVKYRQGIADSSMFNTGQDGSVSIAERMMKKWNKPKPFLNLRKGTKNRQTRIQATYDWLKMAPDGLPYLLITKDCPHLIRTLPILIYDENNIEDVESKIQEDHPWDGMSYMLSAIKWIPRDIGGISTQRGKKAKGPPRHNLNLDPFTEAEENDGRWQRA